MSLLFSKDGFDSRAKFDGPPTMSYGIVYTAGFGVGLIVTLMFVLYFINHYQESNSIALIGQYTVSNYSSANDTFKVFLLHKEKLNGSVILENDNDITERILIARITSDW